MELNQKIIDNLEALDEDYGKLRSLLEEKQEAVIDRKIDRLEKINNKVELLLSEIRELHERREKLWRKRIGGGPEIVTGDHVADVMPEILAGRLADLRQTIKQKVRDIQRLSEGIANRLEDRLSVQERMFDSLYESVEASKQDDDTYDQQGKKDNKADKPSVVIDEAV